MAKVRDSVGAKSNRLGTVPDIHWRTHMGNTIAGWTPAAAYIFMVAWYLASKNYCYREVATVAGKRARAEVES